MISQAKQTYHFHTQKKKYKITIKILSLKDEEPTLLWFQKITDR